MVSSADLQFDKKEVNTFLAQEFMEYNTDLSCYYKNKPINQTIVDLGTYRVHCVESFDRIKMSEKPDYDNYYDTLWTLAAEVQIHINLFCQLDYVVRGKSTSGTYLELKMLIKYLRYIASSHAFKPIFPELLVMDNDTPIIDLGFAALLAPGVDIVATEKTALVCRLFLNLCRKARLPAVQLSFVQSTNIDVFTKDCFAAKNKAKVLGGGCIGVLTAQGDVDSAVAAFLDSFTGVIFGIRRILVEESVSERFRSALAWKTRGQRPEVDRWPCTEAYVSGDRAFLHEYVGDGKDLKNEVLVESFRTVKELLTLLEGYAPFCVTLWSDSVAQSNEIAFRIAAPLVWVNEYGTLAEENYVSAAYYSQLVPKALNEFPFIPNVINLQRDWVKYPIDELYQMLRRCFSNSLKKSTDASLVRSYIQFIDSHQRRLLINSVIEGGKDMVTRVFKPRDVYFIKLGRDMCNFFDVIQRLLNGSGVVLGYSDDLKEFLTPFIEELKVERVPVHWLEHKPEHDSLYAAMPLPEPNRIIHTNYGTVFAN